MQADLCNLMVTAENFLVKIGAKEIDHHGRTLFEHLQGTQQLLQEWGNNQTVVLAGLLHSLYGTQEFKEKALSLDERPKVASLIGADAEELVYLFGVANRRGFYTQSDVGPFCVYCPELEDKQILVSKEQFSALIEIEVANIAEQALHQKNVPSTVVDFWLSSFNSKKSFISNGGIQAYTKALSSYHR